MSQEVDVCLITSNVGSLFEDTTGTIQNSWTHVVCNHLRLRGPDFVALGFQELGGKAKKMDRFPAISSYILQHCREVGYETYGIVVESNPVSPNFSATGTIYLWKPNLDVHIWNHQTNNFVHLSTLAGKADSQIEVSESPFCTHEKFRGNSRKGYISARFKLQPVTSCSLLPFSSVPDDRINQRELDLIAVHNFHDDDNTISLRSTQYVERRAEALRTLVTNAQLSNERAAFIFGDLNNRLAVRLFVDWLIEHYAYTPEDVRIGEREFWFPDQQELFADWHVQRRFLRAFDSEPLEFNKEQEAKQGSPDLTQACILYEPEICFPMTFPLLDDSSGFASTRPPAWCDRMFLTQAAISLLGTVRRLRDAQTGTGDARFQVMLEQPGSEYNIMASESKDQGDHKQVFLSFRIPAAPL